MKLSFVIPAYNEEKLISRCLGSILHELEGKSFDTEIIVVNNNSTDRTKEIAEAFPEVRVVDELKKGLVRARSAGFLASTGELIANIDADTRLTPGWVERVFYEFKKNENLVALSGPFVYDNVGVITSVAVRGFYFFGFLMHLVNHKILKKGAMLQGGNFIVRRSAMEKIGGYDLRIDFWGEDSDVARRIQAVGDVKFTFRLPMRTSGRRIKGEGLIIMGVRYAINHIWIIFFKKPFSKQYEDFRQ